jgi:hypothetical protein
MGFFDVLRKNMPGSPRSVAKSLLKYYLIETSKFPNKNKKEIYSRVLKQRYSALKLMDEVEIRRIVNMADSLMELALLIIAHENPAAMSEYFINDTIKDVAEYFMGNAPEEYKEFSKKATESNTQRDINSDGEKNLNQMPSRYELESQLASLIDVFPLEASKNNDAWIIMSKDFSFSMSIGSKKTIENQSQDELAKVNLREVPNFESLLSCRKEYQNPQHPITCFATDLFAREAVKILLEQKGRIEVEETGRDGEFIAYNNGTVLDTRTNLMWAAKDNGSYIDWQNAKTYCENYRGGGYTDWRMPTQDELAGLYDENKSCPAACNREASLHVATEFIDITCFAPWALETGGSEAAYFNFYNGSRSWITQTDTYAGLRALPVRSDK